MTKHFPSISYISGLGLGALAIALWLFVSTTGIFSAAPQETPLTPEPIESKAVTVAPQSAGPEVMVATLSLPEKDIVWLAVREMQGDMLGNVLGAARVHGTRTNVPISLLRATEPGRAYAVQLYRDDNDGVFDPAINSVYIDFETSTRVLVHFKTTE